MKKLALSFAIPALFASAAQALVINIDDDISGSVFLSNGSSVTGTFDINSSLVPPEDFVTPYDISSATATFDFTDDGELDYQYSTYSSYSYGGGNRYYRTRYNYYLDALEQVQINITGEYSTDETTWYQDSLYSGQTYDGSSSYYVSRTCGSWWSGYYECGYTVYRYYYTNNYNNTSGYSGNLQVTHHFGGDALADLGADGVIDYTVTATQGDIIFNNASMTADITPNSETAQVPEPHIVALLGAGLVGMMAHIRLRSRRKV